MTPEKLWQVKRVSPLGLNKEKSHVVCKVTTPVAEKNDFSSKVYQVPIDGGATKFLEAYQDILADNKISPDGSKRLSHAPVKVEKLLSTDKHEDMSKANAYIFDDLNHRHWDTWQDGNFNHVFFRISKQRKRSI